MWFQCAVVSKKKSAVDIEYHFDIYYEFRYRGDVDVLEH
jgi:hypothetical protein